MLSSSARTVGISALSNMTTDHDVVTLKSRLANMLTATQRAVQLAASFPSSDKILPVTHATDLAVNSAFYGTPQSLREVIAGPAMNKELASTGALESVTNPQYHGRPTQGFHVVDRRRYSSPKTQSPHRLHQKRECASIGWAFRLC